MIQFHKEKEDPLFHDNLLFLIGSNSKCIFQEKMAFSQPDARTNSSVSRIHAQL